MGPKDCKNVKKNEKKTWHQLSTWGLGVSIKTFLYGITVKIAHVEEALRSFSKCLQDNSSSR